MKVAFLILIVGLCWAQNLPRLNIDQNAISTVGISSGAAMAVQLHVAHSKSFVGMGAIATPPYYCAEASEETALTSCMYVPELIDVSSLESYARSFAQSGKLDDLSNLQRSKVWFWSGTSDTVVFQESVRKAAQFYSDLGAQRVVTFFNYSSEHAWITNSYGNDCSYLGSPYINNCGFDASESMLELFYGHLNASSNPKPSNFISFAQSGYAASDWTLSEMSLDQTGYAYVPSSCASGASCKLVVFFHGCQQGYSTIGNVLVQNNGMNNWAENNHIVVLYPQATTSDFLPSNPEGCWDWWGYTNSDYADQSGAQIQTIMNMVSALSG